MMTPQGDPIKGKGKYRIICRRCALEMPPDTLDIHCPVCREQSLLATAYAGPLRPDPRAAGPSRYRDWLPVHNRIQGPASLPGCYRSRNLARALGLGNLWILFSGWWPEKGAWIESCSFKEFEAIGVLSRTAELGRKTMILASAGNTGLAAVRVSQATGIPVIVVAPDAACREFRTGIKGSRGPVFLISLENGTYQDCIDLVSTLDHHLPETMAEGGAYNIARRDFLGLPLVHAVHTMKELPKHYFQSVGSGTGAVAAWEASERLARFNRYGSGPMRLHLVQNRPFTPVVRAWENPGEAVRLNPGEILARVLANPNPPYHVAGGLKDALSATRGSAYGVTNQEIIRAKFTFEVLEGIDIQYPAAACVAGLEKAVENGRVRQGDAILLHITGGGQGLLKRDKELHRFLPSLSLDKKAIPLALEKVRDFLNRIHHPQDKRREQILA